MDKSTISALLKRAFSEWWPHILNIIGAAAGTLLSLEASLNHNSWVTSHDLLLVFCAMVIYSVGYVTTLKRERRLIATTERLSLVTEKLKATQQSLRDLCLTELILLSGSLKFYSSERITLFIPDSDGSGFRVLARYSLNMLLKEVPRNSYPKNEGCLGKAWEDGSYKQRFPKDEGAWVRAQARLNISESIATGIRMKSRDIVAIRIDSPGLNSDALGVVVFESQNDSTLFERGLKRISISCRFHIEYSSRRIDPTGCRQGVYLTH